MRKICRTFCLVAMTAAATIFTSVALHAADDEDDDEVDAAAAAKLAAEELTKAVAKGDQLFHSKEIAKKSCASCHENPDKPNIDLRTRQFAYPAYSRRSKVVVSMQQKINEMMKFNSRGKEFDPAGTDIAAIEAYVASLKTKK